MVAPITLNVRHIKGHTFQVEVDHDADSLGLKVVIWESQHIAVDQQRLVFGGKELEDGIKLSSMGITDGAQLFLVESGFEEIEASQDSVSVASAAVVPPAFAVEQGEQQEQQSGSFTVSMPEPDQRYNYINVTTDEQLSNERISAAVALSKYIRIYCVFMMILTGLSIFECIWSAIPFLMFFAGWFGARKLNRCLILFPLFLTFFIGFFGLGKLICLSTQYDINGYLLLLFIIGILVCLFHIMIFFSIGKLYYRIRVLSCDERNNARARIISRRGCC